MEYIVTKENERIDVIVFEHYGNYDHLGEVLDINASSCDISKQYITVGTVLYLPDISSYDDIDSDDYIDFW